MLRKLALDRSLNSGTAEKLLKMHTRDAEFVESEHPRGKGGKFVKKGSGSYSGGGSSSGKSEGGQIGYKPFSFGQKKQELKVNKRPEEKEERKWYDPEAQWERHKQAEKVQVVDPQGNPVNWNPSTEYNRGPVGSTTSGKWSLTGKKTPEELEELNRVAKEQGFANYEHMRLCAKGLANPRDKYPRLPDSDGVVSAVRAQKITKAGDKSMQHKVSEMDSGKRFAPKPGEMREGNKFAEGSAFNNPKTGRPSKELTKGTGATKLSVDDLYKEKRPKDRHTINQYLDDNGNLTPEREELHAQSVENIFAGKKPKGPGEKKTFTMFGGGSAAGKGGLSDPKRCKNFQSSFFASGTPDKDKTATIDPDELKKDIPEYREMQETDPDHAAAVAHEESSALAKRAMQAAFDNGYDCTLDGTGDGSVESVKKKIQQARDAGYEVNACYVTCPTEMAVERSIERGKRTKRNVPLEAVRSIHSKVSHIFPKVASEFDHVALFDTSKDGKPVLIAECQRGGEIDIKNQELWDAFIAKDHETDD